MDKLFKECAEILTELALDGDGFKNITSEDRSFITNLIKYIVELYNNKDFKNLINGLLDLQKVQSGIYPEDFHESYSDFLLDSAMWGWVFDKYSDKKDPSDDDWEALNYIVSDLKERLFNNEVFATTS